MVYLISLIVFHESLAKLQLEAFSFGRNKFLKSIRVESRRNLLISEPSQASVFELVIGAIQSESLLSLLPNKR